MLNKNRKETKRNRVEQKRRKDSKEYTKIYIHIVDILYRNAIQSKLIAIFLA